MSNFQLAAVTRIESIHHNGTPEAVGALLNKNSFHPGIPSLSLANLGQARNEGVKASMVGASQNAGLANCIS